MRLALIVLFVAAAAASAVSQNPDFVSPKPSYVPSLPTGSVEYTPERFTQALSRDATSGFDVPVIRRVPITSLPNRDWHQSGGMLGVVGVKSRKFRTLPAGQAVPYQLAPVTVENGIRDPRTGRSYTQQETGLTRTYPDGTRFDDVLYLGSWVFEHRVREKVDGRWRSKVVYTDRGHRPPGYTGLKQSCASCHDRAGLEGPYNGGLVPGGDTVFSDSVRWDAARVHGLRLD